MRFALFLIAFSADASLAAPVPKEVRNETKLEGTWKVEALSTNGQPSSTSGYWTIDAEGMLTLHGAPKPPEANSQITFKYDMRTKAIEYTSIGGNRNYPGLYELKGDTLKLCFTLTDQTRPKAVETGPDLNLWTFSRVKPEGK